MSEEGKKKHRIGKRIAWTVLVIVFGVIPCWIFIGGIDCEPPDDADLLLPSDEPYTDEGNGWTILSNVLSQVGKIEVASWMGEGTNKDPRVEAWNLDCGELLFYANPEDYLCAVCDDDDTGRNIPEILSHFTNRTTSAAYVEPFLKSNEWIFTGIDAALAAPKYVPPPIVPVTSPNDDRPFMESTTEILEVNRRFLSSRVKCKIDKGDYDAAVECYRKNLRLATLLQTRCGSLVEYLVGVTMLKESVSFLERELDDSAIPVEKLQAFDNLLKDLPGLSPEAFAHAFKWEYSSCKEGLKLKPVEVVFPDRSGFAKLLLTPISRYAWHPNRCLYAIAERIRKAIQSEVLPCDEGDHWRWKLGWIGVLLPNCLGCSCVCAYGSYGESVKKLSENVASLRHKIAERMASAGTNETIVAAGQYFPLVFTNGCYYTHDMKKIIGVGTGPVVVGGDVDIQDEVSFGNVKTVVIPAGCTNCLDKWRVVFAMPSNLQEIVVAEDHPEIGVSDGVVYDRRTKHALNFIGKEKMINVPKGIIIDDTDLFLHHLPPHEADRLHFSGPLPEFRIGRGSAKDTLASRIRRWWKYKEWGDFKCIFKKQVRQGSLHRASSNLVVTVSRENADERTKSIVKSGMWEGRYVRWGDPE